MQASTIVDDLEGNFFPQCSSEQSHFLHADNKYTSRPLSGDNIDLENSCEDSSNGQECKQQQPTHISLTKALHQTFFYRWWSAGVLKLGSGAPPYQMWRRMISDLVDIYSRHLESNYSSYCQSILGLARQSLLLPAF